MGCQPFYEAKFLNWRIFVDTAGRDALSEELIEQLIKNNLISDPADLYKLKFNSPMTPEKVLLGLYEK